jgi:hypothetical protein
MGPLPGSSSKAKVQRLTDGKIILVSVAAGGSEKPKMDLFILRIESDEKLTKPLVKEGLRK